AEDGIRAFHVSGVQTCDLPIYFESSFETVTGQMQNDDYLPLIPANSLQNTFRVEFKDGKIRKKSTAFLTLQNTFNQKHTSDFERSEERRVGKVAIINMQSHRYP